MITKNTTLITFMVVSFCIAGAMAWFGHYFTALCPFVGMATADLEQWFKKRRQQ